MEAFIVYINYSEVFDKYYIGQTANFESRLLIHNSGLDVIHTTLNLDMNYYTAPYLLNIILLKINLRKFLLRKVNQY